MKPYDQNIEAMVDVVLLDQLGIEQRQKEDIGIALASLNMVQAFSKKASVPIQKVTRELVVSSIAGRRVTAKDVERARRHVEALLKATNKAGSALKPARKSIGPSLRTSQARGTRRKRLAPRRGR